MWRSNGARAAAPSWSYLNSGLRPLRIFPGAHAQTRTYMIHHYTTPLAAKAIKQSGKLYPGSGNRGTGIYATTMHRNAGFTAEEVKIAVRHPKIPDENIAAVITLDTVVLDKLGIEYRQYGNMVVILTDKELDISTIATFTGID